jgi:hypothetical protein
VFPNFPFNVRTLKSQIKLFLSKGDDEMDVQTATVVVTGISIVIGVILSINSRKQELETRQAQLFMQIYNWWNTP